MSLVVILFFFLGSFFLLLAAVGSIKFPDALMRMAAISKASTLGVILCSVATALHFSDALGWLKVLTLFLFFLFSTPVAVQIIARSAYRNGIDFFKNTQKGKDTDPV